MRIVSKEKDNITRVAPNLALGRPTAPQIEDVPVPFDNSKDKIFDA